MSPSMWVVDFSQSETAVHEGQLLARQLVPRRWRETRQERFAAVVVR